MRIRLPNNWEPRSYQQSAWNYLETGGKHLELIAHRRWGKDDICMHWAGTAAFKRISNLWHMLPEYAQARKAIWQAVNPHTGRRRIDEAFPQELRRKTKDDEMLIEFINGSTWQVVGSDRYDSLVGSSPAGIVYSEWALANPAARAYFRPIIAENNGWQVFITTPRGRNHAYQTYLAARADKEAFAEIQDARTTGVFSEEQLEQELKAYIAEFGEDYGRAKFGQEYLCSFDAANLGAILAFSLSEAERDGRISDDIDFDPDGSPLEISADIGRRDSATWWFWQPKVGGYHVIDYDGGWGIDAEDWCDRLQEKLSAYKLSNGKPALGRIWLPHDARAKTFAAKHSAVEIFSKKFGMDKIRVTPDSSKAHRVNAARVLTQKVAFNATKCHQGLNGLREWSYEYDEDKKTFSSEPKHDWASHDGDGYSYGCLIMQMEKPVKKHDQIVYKGRESMTINQIVKDLTRKRLNED